MTSSPDRVLQAAVREHLVREIAQHQVRRPRPVLAVRPRRAGDRLRIGVVALVVAVTVIGSWFAIQAGQQHRGIEQPARSFVPTLRSTTAPRSAVAEVLPDANRQVVGSGSFTGSVQGTFTITETHGPVLHLRNFTPGQIKSRQLLVAVDLASAQCRPQGVGTLAGTISTARTQDVPLNDSSAQMYSDLSYMHAISIWPDDGCGNADTASIPAATIHWQLPAAIRNLARHDTGRRAAANGTVRLHDGHPSRYTVASNDLIGNVASRFGITVQDLLYLNPLRRHGADTTLYTGEQLNLDPANRDYFWR